MLLVIASAIALLAFCGQPEQMGLHNDRSAPLNDTRPERKPAIQPAARILAPSARINTRLTDPLKLVAFAKTLKGIPYKYGAADPADGFDCSGFITYVFNHFGIAVPRSSVEFTSAGKAIPVSTSRTGDLILFTGTDSLVKTVGHMGIITGSAAGAVTFIHATSGKAYSVTETPLNSYYQGRFMKVIRVFD